MESKRSILTKRKEKNKYTSVLNPVPLPVMLPDQISDLFPVISDPVAFFCADINPTLLLGVLSASF